MWWALSGRWILIACLYDTPTFSQQLLRLVNKAVSVFGVSKTQGELASGCFPCLFGCPTPANLRFRVFFCPLAQSTEAMQKSQIVRLAGYAKPKCLIIVHRDFHRLILDSRCHEEYVNYHIRFTFARRFVTLVW